MLVDFLTVIPQTRSMVLITYRPEYDGALARVPGSQMIALAPLHDSEVAELLSELLGSHPSVDELSGTLVSRVVQVTPSSPKRSSEISPSAEYCTGSSAPMNVKQR